MAAPWAVWALWGLAGVALGQERVPLLAWSTERSLWAPPDAPPGGRVVSEQELQELLRPALERGPRTVLLFLQEQLSLEDFTAFGGVFGNEPDGAFPRLQGALDSAGSSLLLPGVSGGALLSLPQTLQGALGAPPPLTLPGGGLGGLRLNRSQPALLVLSLPHSHSSGLMDPREVLTSNDAVLGEVLRVLQEEQVPYTALFTARRPSRAAAASRGDFGGPRRALLARGEGEGPPQPPPLRWPPQGPPQILLWARNLSVSYKGQDRDLTPLTFGEGAQVDTGGSSWDPQEARLVLKYKEVFGGTLNITLLFRRAWFPVSGRPWAWLAEVGVAVGGAAPARFGGRGGAAPSPWAGAAGNWRLRDPSCCPSPHPRPPSTGGSS